MKRLLIKNVLSEGHVGQTITVCGWIRSKRESKGFAFIIISDGSVQDTLQLIVSDGIPSFKELHACVTGAAVKVTGILKASFGKGQNFEVEVSELEVIGTSDSERYPLQKKGHTLEFLREIAHLRPRTNTFGAIFRLRNILAFGIHEFFQKRGFIWVHTPIITSRDCEGAGELFSVTSLNFEHVPRTGLDKVDFSQDFFGKPSYLTVSGQLEAEFLALALGNVYTFGPTFRAENSNTTRHLSEFWMVEPEMAFADLFECIDLAQDFFQSLCNKVVDVGRDELAFLEKQYKIISIEELNLLAGTPFVRISYTDAVKELKNTKEQFEFPVEWGLDLQSEHERFLTDTIFRAPVVVTDYPKEIKAFYMRLNPDDKTVAAMDILVPRVGEIIGGSQREERLALLEQRILQRGIPTEDLQWYLDIRRFGSVPHAGFGLGFERFMQFITGMLNIRDVIPCPRTPKHILI